MPGDEECVSDTRSDRLHYEPGRCLAMSVCTCGACVGRADLSVPLSARGRLDRKVRWSYVLNIEARCIMSCIRNVGAARAGRGAHIARRRAVPPAHAMRVIRTARELRQITLGLHDVLYVRSPGTRGPLSDKRGLKEITPYATLTVSTEQRCQMMKVRLKSSWTSGRQRFVPRFSRAIQIMSAQALLPATKPNGCLSPSCP